MNTWPTDNVMGDWQVQEPPGTRTISLSAPDRQGWLNVHVDHDYSGTWIATVTFTGHPVLIVYDRTEGRRAYEPDYDYHVITPIDGPHEQAHADFMINVGEWDEKAGEWVTELGLEGALDCYEVEIGDGHELTAFVDNLTQLIRRLDV